MRKHSPRPGLFLWLFALAVLPAAGCRLYTKYPERLDLQPTSLLPRENPAEVALLPVVDKTGNPKVQEILPDLRKAFYWKLMDRRYTPLGLGYVDRVLQAQPGGPVPLVKDLLGKFGEDAILLVTVKAWSERLLRVDRRVRASLEIHLVSSHSGREVWGGTVDTEIRAPGHGMPSPDEIPMLRKEVLNLLAAKALALLPKRKIGAYPAGAPEGGK